MYKLELYRLNILSFQGWSNYEVLIYSNSKWSHNLRDLGCSCRKKLKCILSEIIGRKDWVLVLTRRHLVILWAHSVLAPQKLELLISSVACTWVQYSITEVTNKNCSKIFDRRREIINYLKQNASLFLVLACFISIIVYWLNETNIWKTNLEIIAIHIQLH